MSKIHHYTSLIVFSAFLLTGVQLPNFIDQYEKRLDAHYLEVLQNFMGFQGIADQLHDRDILALIDKHKRSTDPTFRAEAEPIEAMYQRKLRFESERNALNTSFLGKVWHVLLFADAEIRSETISNYTATFPLTRTAMISGIIAGLLGCGLMELIIASRRLVPGRKKAV